jgi:hypothetical protein
MIDEWSARQVDDHFVDRTARERERRNVLGGDGGCAVAADGDAVAGDTEIAGLGNDLALADLLVVGVERQCALGSGECRSNAASCP